MLVQRKYTSIAPQSGSHIEKLASTEHDRGSHRRKKASAPHACGSNIWCNLERMFSGGIWCGSAEAREMTFEELLDQACAAASLPEMARIQLPSALSDEIKKMVLQLSPEELGRVLNEAIETVNCGSVEPLDKLVAYYLIDWEVKHNDKHT